MAEHTSRVPRRGYLPTLDGWRAIAIISVIISHDSLLSLGPLNSHWLFLYGGRGVDVFFAISGILICSRLLEEERYNGRISLKNFYIRRAFRILPPAITYLLVLAVLAMFGVLVVYPAEWAEALLFCRNYPAVLHLHSPVPAAWFTAHFWSLSVEEHFYLLLPALLVFLPKRWRIPALSAMTVLIIGNRAIQLTHRPYQLIGFHTDVRLDSLLIPALVAVVMRDTHERLPLYRFLRWWPVLTVPIVGLIVVDSGSIWQTTLIAALMPLLIMGSVLHSKNVLGRFLEWTPLRYIGRISYSLYLWQMLFFTGHFYAQAPLGILNRAPWNYLAVLAVAIGSYHLVELPVMRIGHRFAPSTTPGRLDLKQRPTPAAS